VLDRGVGVLDRQIAVDRRLVDGYQMSIDMLEMEFE
jgi:hypothetical protein